MKYLEDISSSFFGTTLTVHKVSGLCLFRYVDMWAARPIKIESLNSKWGKNYNSILGLLKS